MFSDNVAEAIMQIYVLAWFVSFYSAVKDHSEKLQYLEIITPLNDYYYLQKDTFLNYNFLKWLPTSTEGYFLKWLFM